MTDEKWQSVRNKIYAVIGSVLGILVVLAVVDQASSDLILGLADDGLDIVGQAVGLVGTALAWWKSRSSVTVLSIPAASVDTVQTIDGSVVAGPANSAQTGTILHLAE